MARQPEDYFWMVVAGGIACGTMGIGIGANDVANNFGSSIGSGAIKFGYGVLIAAVFELIGAVALGSSVTDAVRKGVIDPDCAYFQDNPVMLMFGNFCALIAGTIWLLSCSAIGLPVSTTHTIIGTLTGVGLATGEPDIVDWSYLGTVVLSWLTSPLLAGIVGACLFAAVRKLILRKRDGVLRASLYIWVLTLSLGIVFSLFFIFKNPSLKSFSANTGVTVGVGIASGLVVMLLTTPLFLILGHRNTTECAGAHPLPLSYRLTGFPCCLKGTEEEMRILGRGWCESIGDKEKSCCSSKVSLLCSQSVHTSGDSDEEKTVVKRYRCDACGNVQNSFATAEDLSVTELSIDSDMIDVDCQAKLRRRWYRLPFFLDLHKDALADDMKAAVQNESAEKFDVRVESFFASLQILSAIVSCLVHGSNDVANAVAPFSTVYGMWLGNGYKPEYTTPKWVLALGGGSIGIGVLFLGHRVIQAVGMKLIKMTAARGFCVELGMASVMVLGSVMGMPLSTTHCQVGSTIGVGLIDKHEGVIKSKRNLWGVINYKAVNCRLIGKIIVAWIGTLIFSAGVAATLFAFGAYAPSA